MVALAGMARPARVAALEGAVRVAQMAKFQNGSCRIDKLGPAGMRKTGRSLRSEFRHPHPETPENCGALRLPPRGTPFFSFLFRDLFTRHA